MAELETIFDNLPNITEAEREALKEYLQSVQLLAGKKLNLEFNNKDQYHAVIVMSEIFKSAKESVRMFTGSFSGEISNHPGYLSELENAIVNSNKSVEVIFETEPNKESKCLALLKKLKAAGKNISIYLLNQEFRKSMEKKSAVLNHFLLGDSQMFRYETEKNHFKAFCNFDDKKIAERIAQNFAILKVNATIYN